MYIESKNGIRYRLTNSSSIYTHRNGLNDIRLQRESRNAWEGGAMADDGRWYVTIAVWASESLDVIRQYERPPSEVTPAMLQQWFALKATCNETA